MSEKRYVCIWAFLELSAIAEDLIADILLPYPAEEPINHELVVVSITGSGQRATSWLTDHKIPFIEKVVIYRSFERILARGWDFDIAYIATPPHPLHYQHIQTALDHKRNGLVEKPATTDRKQYEILAKRTLATARSSDAIATEHFQYYSCSRPDKKMVADFAFPVVSPELPTPSEILKRA